MLGGMFLAQYAFFDGSSIGEMFQAWQNAGFFTYLLPFLLIFALVYGILSAIKIFKGNKGIDGIIALVVSLMSIQFPMVTDFFSEVFPRLGIGLIIILLLLIMVGLFFDNDSVALHNVFLGVGALIVVVILIQAAGGVGWSSGYWWTENWPMVAGVLVLLVCIGAIVASSSNKDPKPVKSVLSKALSSAG